jgi:hypothetical protein
MFTNQKETEMNTVEVQPEIEKKVEKVSMAEMKKWLKDAAVTIHRMKAEYKDYQRGKLDDFQWTNVNPWEYRHRHIAYSEMRGKTRDQIEKPAKDNLANERLIKKYAEMLYFPDK